MYFDFLKPKICYIRYFYLWPKVTVASFIILDMTNQDVGEYFKSHDHKSVPFFGLQFFQIILEAFRYELMLQFFWVDEYKYSFFAQIIQLEERRSPIKISFSLKQQLNNDLMQMQMCSTLKKFILWQMIKFRFKIIQTCLKDKMDIYFDILNRFTSYFVNVVV